jgi:hypothetical protein
MVLRMRSANNEASVSPVTCGLPLICPAIQGNDQLHRGVAVATTHLQEGRTTSGSNTRAKGKSENREEVGSRPLRIGHVHRIPFSSTEASGHTGVSECTDDVVAIWMGLPGSGYPWL